MKCSEYYNIRKELKDGDMPIYRGGGFMSKSIHYFDSAYYNHIGVVKKIPSQYRKAGKNLASEKLSRL